MEWRRRAPIRPGRLATAPAGDASRPFRQDGIQQAERADAGGDQQDGLHGLESGDQRQAGVVSPRLTAHGANAPVQPFPDGIVVLSKIDEIGTT